MSSEMGAGAAFCSISSPSLHESSMSLAMFTTATASWPAGNESCSTKSAAGPQPLWLRGRSRNCKTGGLKPASSETTQHQAQNDHNRDHT